MSFPLCPVPLGVDFELSPWIYPSFPQKGSLFEADFILLDGIPGNVIRGEKQYVAAPLVMLRMEPNGKLLPMVIQVRCPRHPPPNTALSTSQPLLSGTQPPAPKPHPHTVKCVLMSLFAAWFSLTHPTGSTCSSHNGLVEFSCCLSGSQT